jgi:hypothetical protein
VRVDYKHIHLLTLHPQLVTALHSSSPVTPSITYYYITTPFSISYFLINNHQSHRNEYRTAKTLNIPSHNYRSIYPRTLPNHLNTKTTTTRTTPRPTAGRYTYLPSYNYYQPGDRSTLPEAGFRLPLIPYYDRRCGPPLPEARRRYDRHMMDSLGWGPRW